MSVPNTEGDEELSGHPAQKFMSAPCPGRFDMRAVRWKTHSAQARVPCAPSALQGSQLGYFERLEEAERGGGGGGGGGWLV